MSFPLASRTLRLAILATACVALLGACQPQVVYVPVQPADVDAIVRKHGGTIHPPPAGRDLSNELFPPTPPAETHAPPPPQHAPWQAGVTSKADVEREFGAPVFIRGDLEQTVWIYAADKGPIFLLYFTKGLLRSVYQTTHHELQEFLRQERERGNL